MSEAQSAEFSDIIQRIPKTLHGAFSPDVEIRQQWFETLPLPHFNLGAEIKRMKRINTPGTSAYGNVYKVEKNGKFVAVKFAKASSGSVRIGRGGVGNTVRENYAGLLLANAIRPDVFISPYGVVYSTNKKPVGVAMEYIEDCLEFKEFWEEKEEDGISREVFNPNHRPDRPLREEFFHTLRSAVIDIREAGIVLPDFDRQNVLVDGHMQPRIADVDYLVNPETTLAPFYPTNISIREYDRHAVISNIDFWESEFRLQSSSEVDTK